MVSGLDRLTAVRPARCRQEGAALSFEKNPETQIISRPKQLEAVVKTIKDWSLSFYFYISEILE